MKEAELAHIEHLNNKVKQNFNVKMSGVSKRCKLDKGGFGSKVEVAYT